MTAVTWALLAAAALLAPVADPAAYRADLLAARGRLAAGRKVARPVPALRPDVFAAGGCGLVTAAVVIAGGVVLGAAAAIGSATLARLVLAARARRAGERAQADLLSALRLLAAELEAGGRPEAAFMAAAAADPAHEAQFRAAAGAWHDGRDPPLDTAELRPLASAMAVSAQAGVPLATVVRRVADDCTARVSQRRAVAAATAGAQSSAALLAALPVLGILLGGAMQAHPLGVLFGSPAGHAVCLAGVALDAGGLLWTQRLAARAQR